MSTKKAVFFDIDGTLWGMDNVIPESTKEAIRLLKEHGHLVFLCTGRTRVYLQDPTLLAQNFNGIVSGCGTRIEYNDEVLFDRQLTQEEAKKANQVFVKNGMTVLMEGTDHFYANHDEFIKDWYGQIMYTTNGHLFLELDEHEGDWHASKFTVLMNGNAVEPVMEELGSDFAYMVHGTHVMEVLPNGYSKSDGIRQLCRILDLPMEDTFAFGDSANDIDMLEAVGTGIAMGNGTDETKQHADYITDALTEDGIFNACRHFGLI